MEPISLKRILAPKQLLKFPDIFGSLDRGYSLTKLLYVKSVPDDDSKVSLEMALFPNKNFTEGLDWLAARAKDEGQFNAGKKMRVTGVGGEKYKAEIEDKLKMEVEMVHEFISQQTGAHFLINNFQDDEFCYPEGDSNPHASLSEEPPQWIQTMQKKDNELYSVNDGKRFPAIFGFCGSGVGFNKLSEDMSTDIIGASMHGGKSFLGMAKLIVGTNDYNELMSLAEKGFRGNVDTQVGEMFALDEKSEYRQLPSNLPIFPFGKASDCNECNFSKEDLAAAVIGSFVTGLTPQITAYAKMHRIRRIYLGGHLFSGKVTRDIFNAAKLISIGVSNLKIRFLSNGHTGCIGALLVSEAESTQKKNNMSMG